MMDGLLPKKLDRTDPEQVRKAQILMGFLLTIVLVAILAILFRSNSIEHPLNIAVLVTGVSFVGLAFFFHFTGKVNPTTIVACSVMSFAVVVASYYTGGINSQLFDWNIFVVLLSIFMLGTRWSILLVILIGVEVGVIYYLGQAGHTFPTEPLEFRAFNFLMRTFLIVMAGFLVGWMYDSSRKRAEEAKNQSVAEKEKAQAGQKAAEMASQAKSDFLATMSHELRTPLNAIIGYSEMLAEEAGDYGAEEMEPDLQKICQAGKHLLALINDILDFSKIEAGKMTLHPESFHLDELLMEMEQTIQPLASQNNNTLVCEAPPSNPRMLTDRVKVRQCLLNLLSNASKFTHEGQITFKASTTTKNDKEYVVFQVTDEGIGMSPDQLNHLFEKFTQADSTTSRKYGGTGLGLAITQRLIHLLEGSIEVESQEGVGTTFTLHLPVALSEEHTLLIPPPATSPNTNHVSPPTLDPENRTVLVIDDDPTVLDMMTRFLTKEGFQVVSSSSGEEGLRIAEKILPFAITLDVMMKGMNGWSVLSQIKAKPELTDTPVIMVTIVDDFKRGYALGASEFLTKPFDRDAILAILQKYQPQHKPWDVLIVEDDTHSRELLVSLMQKEGWNTREAKNGLLALEAIEDKEPDLILLDLMMPEMDGFEFLDVMRNKETGRNIPTIIITAKELTEEDHQQLSGYMENILAKGGFTKEQLFDEIRSLVRSSRNTV